MHLMIYGGLESSLMGMFNSIKVSKFKGGQECMYKRLPMGKWIPQMVSAQNFECVETLEGP